MDRSLLWAAGGAIAAFLLSEPLLAAEAGQQFAQVLLRDRGFLRKECKNVCELLMSDPETARQELRKRINKLVLTPKAMPDGTTVLEVSGRIAVDERGRNASLIPLHTN